MADAPLSSRRLARDLKARRSLREPSIQIVFEPTPRSPQAGVRVFAAPVKGNLLKRPARSGSKKAALPEIDASKLEGFLPDHLALNPHRPHMDKRFKRGKFFDPHKKLEKGEYQATTIFPPDVREVFSDTSSPWCTTGKVDLGGGWGSGVLVGPRHLLCASHMMTWNPDNTVNQVTFTPSYFDGNAPFGNSGITNWYAYRKVVGPILSGDDIEQDYVVLVLSNRLGDVCGWMGTRGYDDSWNGLSNWMHIGYPGDLTGGERPTFQNGIAINGTAGNDPTDEELLQQADVWPGQSGGPFFGWWTGEPWPRVVAVQSAQNPSTNLAGAGNDIPNMVNQARSDFP
jgi:V8-like Glu-specific endopeptidase